MLALRLCGFEDGPVPCTVFVWLFQVNLFYMLLGSLVMGGKETEKAVRYFGR